MDASLRSGQPVRPLPRGQVRRVKFTAGRRDPTTLRYVLVPPTGALPDLAGQAPFKAVLAAEVDVDRVRRDEICRWLVAAGCRYLIPHGPEGDAWCAAVRSANLAEFDIDVMAPTDFVMTTSHPYESLRAIVWYAKKAARHPDVEFTELLMLHVSETDRSTEYRTIYEKA